MAGFRCPRCRKSFDVEYPGVLPFCSPRCKLADLNGWLEEAYALPTNLEADPDEETPEDQQWQRRDEDDEQLA